MFDNWPDQGHGLRCMAPQSSWSVAAMVSQGDSAVELPLLWQVCAALQKFSYRVTVLDATSTESAGNPGLLNLLEQAHWLEDASTSAAPWQVVPARLGLNRLVQTPRQEHPMPLQSLGHLFRNCDALLLYGSVALLTALLPHSRVRPLLTVAPLRTSLLRSYRNFKNLRLQAQLTPLLVATIATPFQGAENQARNAGRALQTCARRHLDCHTDFMTFRAFPQYGRPWNDAHHIALRMMAHAMPMAHGPSPMEQRRMSHHTLGEFH